MSRRFPGWEVGTERHRAGLHWMKPAVHAGDGAALGQAGDIQPDSYEAALFEGERQATGWVVGPPCRFGVVKPGPDRYKIRIPDGRIYAGRLPVRPAGGTFTLEGPFRWADGLFQPFDMLRER